MADLIFAQDRLYKPVVVKEIVSMMNNSIWKDLIWMEDFAVFDEKGFTKHKIILDFE